MKNLHFVNSYRVWNYNQMLDMVFDENYRLYDSCVPSATLNRSYSGMIVEWYLHNIGYWITLPFVKYPKIAKLNERFKHLDLEEHKK